RGSDAATVAGTPALICGPASKARSQISNDETTPATTSTAQMTQGSRLRIPQSSSIRRTQSTEIYGTSANIPQTGGLRDTLTVFFPSRFARYKARSAAAMRSSARLELGESEKPKPAVTLTAAHATGPA